MNNIAYFEPDNAADLVKRLQRCVREGRSLRIQTGTSVNGNWLKFKIGEGGWSPPLLEDPDPYRDGDVVAGHFVGCPVLKGEHPTRCTCSPTMRKEEKS